MPDVSPATNVAAVSDVEGNWEYFERFVQLSEAVSFAGGEPTWDRDGVVKLELADGWHLVHGGDCADKGGPIGGTVRVARSLVDLKKRYPDRVTLILGNRDLNK